MLKKKAGSCFSHASSERGREASWYSLQRDALEQGGEGMAEIEIKLEKQIETGGRLEVVFNFDYLIRHVIAAG